MRHGNGRVLSQVCKVGRVLVKAVMSKRTRRLDQKAE